MQNAVMTNALSDARRAFIIAVAYLKGGVRKTTSVVFLAYTFAQRGHTVLVVDADKGTQGVVEWASDLIAADKELKFHVRQWSPDSGLLVSFIKEQARATGATIVLVDVGGEDPDSVGKAAKVADLVLSPVGCEKAELKRMGATVATVKGEGDVPHYVLLTRVPQPGKGTAREVREMLAAGGVSVFKTEITHNKDRYSHVFGDEPGDLGEYAELANELDELMERIH